MLSGIRSGKVKIGYPWEMMDVMDYFVVPLHTKSPSMVRKAAFIRALRHGEKYQAKLMRDSIYVVRLQ